MSDCGVRDDNGRSLTIAPHSSAVWSDGSPGATPHRRAQFFRWDESAGGGESLDDGESVNDPLNKLLTRTAAFLASQGCLM